MCVVSIKLTVYFEEPFWVGIFERRENREYQAARFIFGSEPKDYEVYEMLLKEFHNLRFSKPIPEDKHNEKKINPKKLQKKIKSELEKSGSCTKAQAAIKLQQEQNKTERHKRSKEEKEQEEERKFELRKRKKKEKHKGH